MGKSLYMWISRAPQTPWDLTRHAESKDAAMLLQKSLEQGALSGPRRSTQDNRPWS